MSIAAPQVIALRTSPLAAYGRDYSELARMGTEKAQALQEAVTGMGFQIFRSNVEWAQLATRQWWLFWQNAWRWYYPFGWMSPSAAVSKQFRRSAAGMMDQALAPAHGRVTRNLRRLSRPKKR
jgi:hypothetical protein